MTREDAIEKVRKLLRLARDKSASENEAAVAMEMAQRIMMQHDIQEVEEAIEQAAIRGDWKSFKINQRWQQLLASAAADLYNCKYVMRTRSNQVRFYGKQSSVLVAADTLEWFNDQMSDLFKLALKEFKVKMTGGGRVDDHVHTDFRKSFKEACALRVFHRVHEILAKARNEIPGHMALVVIDQAKAKAEELLKEDGVKEGRAMRLKSGYGTGAGRAAGDHIKLQHTVKSNLKSLPCN